MQNAKKNLDLQTDTHWWSVQRYSGDIMYAGTEQIEADVAWRTAYDNSVGSCAKVGVDDMDKHNINYT